jgi:hypothetical protein
VIHYIGADILASYEASGLGVQWSNISYGYFNFSGVLQFLLLDFFLYGLLAWYLDQVYPHEFGTPKHPLFLFMPSYWSNTFSKRISKVHKGKYK